MEQDIYTKTLSQNFKAIRRSKGLTTVDLAKILGVSQAKISYIEHCKGVLSAHDIAVLARRLNVPVTEFFRGIDKAEDRSTYQDLVANLVHYGAAFLKKPAGVVLKEVPFEEVITHALGFIEDDRLHKGFCAALIIQAATKEINVDRIFALIGNNPFLVRQVAEEAIVCLQLIPILDREKKLVGPRAENQINKILSVAKDLLGDKIVNRVLDMSEISDLGSFVGECLHAKR